MDRWLRGRKHPFAKWANLETSSVGSNPTLSATSFTSIFLGFINENSHYGIARKR